MGTPFITLFEEALADYIKEWQASGKSPYEDVDTLKMHASELEGVALDPIPAWRKTAEKRNGIFDSPIGEVLIQDGQYVKISDLVERLPRIIDNVDEL